MSADFFRSGRFNVRVATPSDADSRKCLGEYCTKGSVTGLADVLMESPLFIVVAMTVSRLRSTHALNLSAGNRDGLPCDRAGSLAAEPKHGIGDFRWGHEPRLRIVSGKFSNRLLVAAVGFLHDVVDDAGHMVLISQNWAPRISVSVS